MPPASPTSSERCEPQVLDLHGAVDRMGGDQQLMRELAEIFLDDNVALLEDLKCAIAVSDPLRTERFAHSLKGIAANIGGIRVEAAALAVEEAARSGSLELAQLAVAPLAVELDRLRDALRRLVLGQRTIAST